MAVVKLFSTACIWLISIQHSFAQLSINPDWRERNGITTASAHVIRVPAKFLRGFVTLEAADADPRNAIALLKAKKKFAAQALNVKELAADNIRFTLARILEWEPKPKGWDLNGSNTTPLSTNCELQQYTAITHLTFDIPIAGTDPDELVLLPNDICKRLRSQEVFKSCQLVWLYVGQVTDEQVKEAKKKAYNEALEDAKSIASISGKTLGKLAALTPELEGRWMYWVERAYAFQNDETTVKNALASFSPAENEAFGNDPSKLTRTYSIELRFDIE